MGELINVAFVGSGVVNFGGFGHPWNHSKRLEELGGVNVVAIVDPLTNKGQEKLAEKLAGSQASSYKDCKVYADIDTALMEKKIQVAFVGVPPFCHGAFSDGKDVELRLLQAGVHVFVEKPLSVTPPEEFQQYMSAVTEAARKSNCIIGVGYMLRYHGAIERIMEELARFGRPVVAINARYACTYTNTRPSWWDRSFSGGPIVEQATHFCDLIRYFGGEVDLGSIQGYSVPTSRIPSNIGYLNSLPTAVKDASIPVEDISPCVTQCVWKFENGGLGSLTHTVLLHDSQYETCIDIWCDGLRLTLSDPYLPSCTLKIRKTGSIKNNVLTFTNDDPYLEELRIFLKAVSLGDNELIRSPYDDAAKTYELSWAIRRATFM